MARVPEAERGDEPKDRWRVIVMDGEEAEVVRLREEGGLLLVGEARYGRGAEPFCDGLRRER